MADGQKKVNPLADPTTVPKLYAEGYIAPDAEEIEEVVSHISFDAQGLVPAVVQDVKTNAVVMLAYMNANSIRLMLETGYTWFWSRSRKEYWNKGATSHNMQKLVEMYYDCDGDAVLVKAELEGPACHTGSYSCFFNKIK